MPSRIANDPRFLRAVLETAGCLVCVLNREGLIVAFNQECERLTGWQEEEVQNRFAADLLIPQEWRTSFEAALQTPVSGELPITYEFGLLTRTGVTRLVEWRTTVLRSDEGEVTHIIATGIDVTERKAAENALRSLAERLALAIEATGLGTIDVDMVAGLADYSPELKGMYGLSPEADLPTGSDLVPLAVLPEDHAKVAKAIRNSSDPEGDGRMFVEHRILRTDGSVRWLRVSGKTVFDQIDGRRTPTRFVGTFFDITENKRYEERILASERQVRTIAESMHEGLVVQDEEARVTFANPAASRILGLSHEQLQGRMSIDDSWRTVREDGRDFPGNEHPAVVALNTGEVQRGTVMGVHRTDGSLVWIVINSVPISGEGERPTAVITSFSDATELKETQARLDEQIRLLKQANARLLELANTDGLTGLFNHRAFHQRLAVETSQAIRHHLPLATMMIDVDWFKQYNDSFGHPAGDELLIRLSETIRGAVRPSDFVARYGGEEIGVLMPMTDCPGAAVVAERVRHAIETTPMFGRPVTVSIGVAQLEAGESGISMIERADAALYRAKRNGRNRVEAG